MLALELSLPPPATAFAPAEALRPPEPDAGVGEVFGAGWEQPIAASAASEPVNTMAFIMCIGFVVKVLVIVR